MRIYDTHAHFGSNEKETAEILARAATAGVERLMAVGGSDELNAAAQTAHRLSSDAVRLALGADRDQCGNAAQNEQTVAAVRALLTKIFTPADRAGSPLAAIGEIGADGHYAPDTLHDQCDLFLRQLALADEWDLPVVIHTREADDATLGVLDEIPWHGSGLRGIIHCYTGSVPFEKKLLDRGFMVSISGIVTFRAAENVREAARYIPDDRLLIETDAPFLAPVPLRGNANEPAFIVHTAEFLANLRNVPVEKLTAQAFANAVSLLG